LCDTDRPADSSGVPWWGWALIGWATVATLAGLLLGAAAARARTRERRWRLQQYLTAPDEAKPTGRHRKPDPGIPPQRGPGAEVGEAEEPRHLPGA
jgi:hypothetical protein